jgi:hypothetical protein
MKDKSSEASVEVARKSRKVIHNHDPEGINYGQYYGLYASLPYIV